MGRVGGKRRSRGRARGAKWRLGVGARSGGLGALRLRTARATRNLAALSTNLLRSRRLRSPASLSNERTEHCQYL